MKLIDIWHEELRKFGINKTLMDEVTPHTDKANPVGAVLMRQEVKPEHEQMFRKMFAEMAEHLIGECIRKRQ